MGFGFKIWGRGSWLSFENAAIAEKDRQPYGGGGDCGYTFATRIVFLGYCVLRDLCGGDDVFRGGGLCYRQYICCFVFL